MIEAQAKLSEFYHLGWLVPWFRPIGMSQRDAVAPWWTILSLITAMHFIFFQASSAFPVSYPTPEATSYQPQEVSKEPSMKLEENPSLGSHKEYVTYVRKRRNITTTTDKNPEVKSARVPFKVMPLPNAAYLAGRKCSGCKTLVDLSEKMYQKEQAKKRSANLTILPLTAVIVFFIGLGIKCSHWCHEDIRIADDKHLKISQPPTIVFPKHEKKKKKKRRHGVSDLGSAMAQMGVIPLAVLTKHSGFGGLKPPGEGVPQRSVSSDNVRRPKRSILHRASLPGLSPRPRQGSVGPEHSPITEDIPDITYSNDVKNVFKDKVVTLEHRITKEETSVSSPSSSGVVSRSDSGLETTPLIHNSPGLSPVTARARDRSPRIFHGNANLLALQSARLLLRSSSTSGSSAETLGTMSTSISSMASGRHHCHLKGVCSDGSEFDPDSVDGTGTENSQEDTGLSSTTSLAEDFAMSNSMDKDNFLAMEIPGFDRRGDCFSCSPKSPEERTLSGSSTDGSDKQSSRGSSHTGTIDSAIHVDLANSRSLGSICEDSDAITENGAVPKTQRTSTKVKCTQPQTNLACIPSPTESESSEEEQCKSRDSSGPRKYRSRTASGDSARSNGFKSRVHEQKMSKTRSHDFTMELLSRLERLTKPSNGCKSQNGLKSKLQPRRSWCIADSHVVKFREQLNAFNHESS